MCVLSSLFGGVLMSEILMNFHDILYLNLCVIIKYTEKILTINIYFSYFI